MYQSFIATDSSRVIFYVKKWFFIVKISSNFGIAIFV